MSEAVADVEDDIEEEEVAAAVEEGRTRENRLSVGSLDKHMGFTGSRTNLQLKAHSGDIAPYSPRGASTGCPPSSPSWSVSSESTKPTKKSQSDRSSASQFYISGIFCKMGDEFRSRMDKCQKGCSSMPEVALLVPQGAFVPIPQSIQTTLEGSVKHYGDDFRLLVLKLSPGYFGGDLPVPPAEQLVRLEAELQETVPPSTGTHFLWPLHRQRVSDAVMARMAQLVTETSLRESQETVDTAKKSQESKGAQSAGCWFQSFRQCNQRMLAWFCICPPPKDGLFLKFIKEQYGRDTEFCFHWGAWYAQQLWLLVLLVVASLVLQVEPVGGNMLDRQRLTFEVFKVLVWVWSIKVAWQGQKLFKPNPARSSSVVSSKRPSFKPATGCWQKAQLWLKLIGIAGPLLIMFYVGVIFLLIGYTMLILHVIYEWGDCINLHRPEQPCRDPQVKFGFLGWLAEVTCDVILAIIFELLYLAGQFLAERIAQLRNYEFQSDHVLFVGRWTVALSVLDRIGFAFTLAFLYVPQWEPPSPVFGLETVDPTRDCSDLLFGDSSFLCLQRRLPVQSRRWVFRKLMKGPFCVAPFVQLAMTVIVPLAARWIECIIDYLYRCTHNKKRHFIDRMCCPVRGLARLLSLIFTYECDSTGNLRYIVQGEPFSDLKIVHPDMAKSPPLQPALMEGDDDGGAKDGPEEGREEAAAPSMRLLENALFQVKHKPFETYDELLNEKMSLLWVLFFSPVLGYGVIFTLFARILRMKLLIPKLLYIRRRSFPVDDTVGRKMQVVFTWVACFASFGWSFGLSVITYNDDLHKEAIGGILLTGCLVVWLGAAVVMLFHCQTP